MDCSLYRLKDIKQVFPGFTIRPSWRTDLNLLPNPVSTSNEFSPCGTGRHALRTRTRLSSLPGREQYQTFREVVIETFRHVDTRLPVYTVESPRSILMQAQALGFNAQTLSIESYTSPIVCETQTDFRSRRQMGVIPFPFLLYKILYDSR